WLPDFGVAVQVSADLVAIPNPEALQAECRDVTGDELGDSVLAAASGHPGQRDVRREDQIVGPAAIPHPLLGRVGPGIQLLLDLLPQPARTGAWRGKPGLELGLQDYESIPRLALARIAVDPALERGLPATVGPIAERRQTGPQDVHRNRAAQPLEAVRSQ